MTDTAERGRRSGGRAARQAARLHAHVEHVPFLTRTLQPVEVLSDEGLSTIETNADRILEEVVLGRAEAGLIIHEGQLTYDQHGLEAVVDLGEWWLLETGLPLPLGINVARRDLGEETLQELSAVLRESIAAALSSRREALEYALQFGRGLDEALADRFVGMYVNELTEDYGDEGREAVVELLRRGEQAGAFDAPVRVEFVA